MDHAGRLSRLRSGLEENDLDVLLVTHLPNLHYLCGFTGSAAALLVATAGSILFTDGRYRTQAHEEVQGTRIVVAHKSPIVAAAEWLAARRRNQLRSWSASNRNRSPPPRATLGLHAKKERRACVPRPPLVERARMVKDAAEILRIRRAVELGASLFRIACRKIRPGVLRSRLPPPWNTRRVVPGPKACRFQPFLRPASAPRLCMAGPRGRRVRGAGSWSAILVLYSPIIVRIAPEPCMLDVLRTGRGSFTMPCSKRNWRRLQQYTGVTCAQVDGAARGVVAQEKTGALFHHSTRHGLGLEIHEAPRLRRPSPEVGAGMVITMSPALRSGKWGVRIEDVVVVTSSAAKCSRRNKKELVVFYSRSH